MKSMFEMGFSPSLFGASLPSPMLGQVPMRGSGPKMAQTMAQSVMEEDGDALLKQLYLAQRQAGAANAFIRQNLQSSLGLDYDLFQQNMSVIASTAPSASNVLRALQATAPGDQYSITEGDRQASLDYIAAAAQVSALITKAGGVSVLPMPVKAGGGTLAPTAAAAPSANDLTLPLIVGGSLLTIGLVALLARA